METKSQQSDRPVAWGRISCSRPHNNCITALPVRKHAWENGCDNQIANTETILMVRKIHGIAEFFLNFPLIFGQLGTATTRTWTESTSFKRILGIFNFSDFLFETEGKTT